MNFRFLTDDPNDFIQKYLAKGVFFEAEELEVMKKYATPNGVILDIGANVGNHAVYFSKFFDAKKIYVFEPVVRSYKLLLANLCLNYCHNVNVDFVGVALGHMNTVGYPYMKYLDNLGSVTLHSDPVKDSLFEQVPVMPGDILLQGEHVDFIKMDIEGMEMLALQGLHNTITQSRPNIYVEVDGNNMEEFTKWLIDNQYESVWSNSYLDVCYNYMLLPKEKINGYTKLGNSQ